jgi:hypothetical protein
MKCIVVVLLKIILAVGFLKRLVAVWSGWIRVTVIFLDAPSLKELMVTNYL